MRRIALAFLLLPLLLVSPLLAKEGAAPGRTPSIERLRATCEWLTSVERMGRLAWKDRERTAAYVAQGFREAGLQPPPGRQDLYDDHPAPPGGFGKIRNVVGWLPGRLATKDPAAPGPYVIVSAHYDHLGARRIKQTNPETGASTEDLVVWHGADDNASGVAALLEIARLLVGETKQEPYRNSILFVAFDLEEQNLAGSRAFVEKPPLPLSALRTFVTMDMLGRSLADVAPGALFLMGTEYAPALTTLLDGLPAPRGGRTLLVGIDFQPGYSDYVAFAEKHLPYVFVTSGACRDYHQPTDTIDKLDWPHLQARVAWCRDLVLALARTSEAPTWSDTPKHPAREMKDLRAVIGDVERNAAALGLPPMATAMLQNYGTFLDKILEDGKVTGEERTTARTTALALFRVATQLARPR